MGSLLSNDLVWELADMFNQLMVLPNVIGLIALGGGVAACARTAGKSWGKAAAKIEREHEEGINTSNPDKPNWEASAKRRKAYCSLLLMSSMLHSLKEQRITPGQVKDICR